MKLDEPIQINSHKNNKIYRANGAIDSSNNNVNNILKKENDELCSVNNGKYKDEYNFNMDNYHRNKDKTKDLCDYENLKYITIDKNDKIYNDDEEKKNDKNNVINDEINKNDFIFESNNKLNLYGISNDDLIDDNKLSESNKRIENNKAIENEDIGIENEKKYHVDDEDVNYEKKDYIDDDGVCSNYEVEKKKIKRKKIIIIIIF